jgi:hypothetical protein
MSIVQKYLARIKESREKVNKISQNINIQLKILKSSFKIIF